MTNTENLRFDISSQSISSHYHLECNFFTKEEDETSFHTYRPLTAAELSSDIKSIKICPSDKTYLYSEA